MSSENNIQQTSYIEEDEIDLRELWKTILAGKKIIAIVMSIVVLVTFIYVLKLPNVYKSEAILIPSENSSGGGLGGLGGLAAMAGVSVGSASMTPDIAFTSLLNDYEFMKKFVVENGVLEYYQSADIDKNYVFALGFRGVYDFFKSSKEEDEDEEFNKEDAIFETVKLVRANMSISSDKKTGLITVSYNDSDRSYPPKIIENFLRDASKYLIQNNLSITNSKLGYFEQELQKADAIELRQSISATISGILKEKIMMQSKKYYQCDVLTMASEAYIKDKAKPKRALILVVSFVTSLILGVFLVFFLNFISNNERRDG
jgi:uncharacterized protein involved in exopolysaccharide biosynthesis